MKINSVGWKLMFYLLFTMIIMTFVFVMLGRLIGCFVLYFKMGVFEFDINDIFYALKGSLGGGIPLAIGIWLISKKEENERKKLNK